MFDNRKDLLGLKGVTKSEIISILDQASSIKHRMNKGSKEQGAFSGRKIVTLFYESSTRTRLSFELAAKNLGIQTFHIFAQTSSVEKGESIQDTVKTLADMNVDAIIMRHPFSGAPHIAAKVSKASIINAGDGANEHPTQALLDLFTIQETFGAFLGLRVAIVGDILHSRVARSNIWGLTTLGAEVSIIGPPTIIPKGLTEIGVKHGYDVKEAVKDVDVLIALRVQKERQAKGLIPSNKEYNDQFGIKEAMKTFQGKGPMIMHPGPVNRGVEIDSDIIDSDRSLISQQVFNGLVVRMAVLKSLMRGNDR